MPRAAPVLLLATGILPALTATAAAQGQEQEPEYSRFTGSLSLLNTQPVGELSTGPGFGIALTGEYALDARRILRAHAAIRGAIYDHERRQVCFSSTVGCRVVLDLDTNYSVAYFGLGPQLVLPLGPTALALDLTGGWTMFTASSSLSGIDESSESFGNTTNHEDHGFGWSTGGELRVRVGRQADITVGARYQRNGRMSYVREGDITDFPDGSIGVEPRTSDANLVAITIGLAFRPLRDRDRDRIREPGRGW